jgi:hypothetical protein
MIDPNISEMKADTSLEAVNAKTKFVETGGRKIAYRSIGKGLPIIMVNRFRTIGSMKLKHVDFMTQCTTLVTFRNNGMSHTQGKGSIYKDNNELASYTVSGITKPNSPNGASSRGMSRTRCSFNDGKVSSLDDKVAVYELEQDNEGNYTAKFWEWK